MEKVELDKTLLKKEVSTKAMLWFVVDLERTASYLVTDNRLLIRKSKVFVLRS